MKKASWVACLVLAVAACGVAPERVEVGSALVLALVESVILQRKRGVAPTDLLAAEIADAALRVLDLTPEVRARAAIEGARLVPRA